MVTFRDKNPPNLNGFPTIPTELRAMVGSSGPCDGAGGYDGAQLLKAILANAAQRGQEELEELQDSGVNDPNPLLDPYKVLSALDVLEKDCSTTKRPDETLETKENRAARKAKLNIQP